jgi:hypothetical protein
MKKCFRSNLSGFRIEAGVHSLLLFRNTKTFAPVRLSGFSALLFFQTFPTLSTTITKQCFFTETTLPRTLPENPLRDKDRRHGLQRPAPRRNNTGADSGSNHLTHS